MILYKFRARNPNYDRSCHFSTGPEWFISVPNRAITDPQEAQAEAEKLQAADGRAWEPTPR